ncbi:MAG: hypothetical protein PX635_00740 [Nostocales cyanobacterium LE14-WE12]|jgi:hypothetical protein|nr:hypothetical protein [Nostocales cyanobacterium LE14-WE12]
MVNTRLILVNEQNTGSPAGNFNLDCPYFDNIPVPITFQISEVRDINSAINGSYSKSIKIPGSPEVNLFFENVYDVNISLSKFNPNLKVKAYYYVDEILNFDGHLQILGIEQDETNSSVIYRCNIIGEVVTLFTKIKNLYLDDIDLTATPTELGVANWTHTLNYTNLLNSWNNPGVQANGYYYGFIDWGVNNSNMSFVNPAHLRACMYARVYLYAIFNAAGYTWTSTFLDSTFFKRLVIPPTEPPIRSSALINASKFYAQATGVQTFSKSLTFNSSILSYSETTKTDIAFQTEIYDTGNIFATPSFTPSITAKYNLNVNVGLDITITRNAADATTFCWGINGAITYSVLASNNVVVATGQIQVNQIPVGLGTFNVSIPIVDTFLYSTLSYKVVITFTNPTFQTTLSAGTWLLNSTLSSGSNFSAELASANIVEGDSVNPNTLIPLNVKQSDFVRWIFKKFNLQCTVDKSIPNNLLIEPEPTFRLLTSRTWEHDTGAGVEIIPLGELDNNKLIFQDKEDGDYYNKLYQDEYKESYGIHRKDITNDFIKSENVYESGFSATPYAVNPNYPAIIPQILTKTNAVITPCKPNIRLLYVGGNVTLPNTQWTLTGGTVPNSQIVYTTIPAVGMTDNPYSPTLDLAWGQVKRIYAPQGILPTTWTTNNNYNKYYSQWVNRISDKNSKIVRGRFKLRPHDIAIFDPRYPIFTVINGEQGYYLVNKIEDYNPLMEETTMCELLKLTDYSIFVPGTYSISDTIGGGNMGNA